MPASVHHLRLHKALDQRVREYEGDTEELFRNYDLAFCVGVSIAASVALFLFGLWWWL